MRKTKMPKIVSVIIALCALAGIGTGVLPEWLSADLLRDLQQSTIEEKETESSRNFAGDTLNL